MEGKEFEDTWKKALTGAEAEPSESVWSSVESVLIAAENQKMKRQVVLYQRLAAASVIFALMISGALGYYNWIYRSEDLASAPTPKPVTPQNPVTESTKQIAPPPDNKETQPDVKPLNQNIAVRKTAIRNFQNTNQAVQARENETRQAIADIPPPVVAAMTDTLTRQQLVIAKESQNSLLESPVKIQKKKEESIVVPGLNTPVVAEENERKQENRQEKLWASLGLSAGSYNPGSMTVSSTNAATAFNPNGMGAYTSSRPGMGTSYSVGVTLGRRLTDRWVIQGGINYLNQRSGYFSDVTAGSPNQTQALDYFNAKVASVNAVTFTSPYQINSTLEFITIPVQAGYLLVDRKVGFQMNAGVATDFFVRNSLEDQSGQANSYSKGAGADSPYRSVNWAGLVSSELSYKMGKQYRISLVPGVRYLFNSSLKSGATNNSYIADIGFRFRYILR